MALTKPRAYQIYDIDYKQAVRVVSTTNVTLAGGAPNSVDGVTLSLNDRILVVAQSSGAQNGIYYVTTLGSGANGTWTRAVDTNTTGELLSGTVVMVTEGTTYADTQWKLTTNDPITLGSTSLTFVQNYLANSISYGTTSFAIGSSNANATISVAGTSNVAVFASTGEYVSGLISATGAITGNTVTASGTTSGYLVNASGVSTGIAMIASTGRSSGTTGALLYLGGNSNPSGTSGYLMNGQHNLSPQQDLSSWYGLLFLPTLQSFSGNIGSMYNQFLRLDTGATGNANISNWYGSFVATPSFTVGSTPVVGTWVGYAVQDQNNAVANAVTVRGFDSRVNRGTNRWGAYFSGTANNYFAGNVSIGTTSAGNALDISGNLYITGNINGSNVNVTNVFATNGTFTNNVIVAGTLTATSNIIANTSGIFYGNTTTGNAAIYAGVLGFTTLGSNVVVQMAGNVNSYSQINFENINSGTEASTDYIATADNGNDSTNFVDLGIGSSTYAPVAYPAFRANDAYLLNNGGNLLLNSQTAGKLIKFIVGGSANTDIIATLSNTTLSMTGAISASGNVTGNYLLGNVFYATGISASKIYNGTTEANIGTASGNANISVGGTSNVAVFAPTGQYITGLISATGNLTAGNITTTIANVTTFNSAQGGNVTGTLIATSSNAQFFNQTNGAGYVTIAGYLSAVGNLTTAANVSGNYLLGNVFYATGISANKIYNGTTEVAIGSTNGNANISVGGTSNVTVFATTGQYVAGVVSATGNVTGRYFIGNANVQYTAATAPVSGNLIGAQWYNTSTDVLYEYQTDGTSTYWVDITGPIIGSNGAAAGTTLTNGTSNVSVALNGNATVNIASTPNVVVWATTGEYVTGVVSASGNITSAANISGGNLTITGIATVTGTITSNGSTNGTAFAVGNSAVSNVALGYFPTVGTAAQMAIRDYSTVASTMYFDTTIGSANTGGSFSFRGSNAFTTYATINQYGVNQPTRPAFRVYGNTSTNFTSGTTLTNQVIDYNQGSNYVNSTGIFTAPVAGLYSVWLNARAGATASLSQIAVLKNGNTSGANTVCFWEITTNATQTTHFGVSSVTKLAVGDTLQARVVAGGVNFDNNDNWGAAYIG